ncbi:hypothetical protein [Amycolatopsis anabasis]|uniref:hypothetical protein n=1 Tax=Amycolatopsis anabasis TaxID=1840409 RepID=UPI00131A6C90|nr:hypothetical protein [Amycolatopsis anabasis]
MALVFAILVMVALVLIPRRLWYLQIPAILSWAAIWVDNEVSNQWTDWVGAAIFAICLAGLGFQYQRQRSQIAR